jgi:hypothetical protein
MLTLKYTDGKRVCTVNYTLCDDSIVISSTRGISKVQISHFILPGTLPPVLVSNLGGTIHKYFDPVHFKHIFSPKKSTFSLSDLKSVIVKSLIEDREDLLLQLNGAVFNSGKYIRLSDGRVIRFPATGKDYVDFSLIEYLS